MKFRIILFIFIIYSTLSFSGCPNLLVDQIDRSTDSTGKFIAKTRPTVLRTGRVDINEIEEKQVSDTSLKNISRTGNNNQDKNTNKQAPIAKSSPDTLNIDSLNYRLEILSINDSDFPKQIKMKVLIYDSQGNYITGLGAPYFKGPGELSDFWPYLYDSCSNSGDVITDLNVEEIRSNAAPPYALVYILDHSASMGNNRIELLQKVIRKMIQVTKDGDYISVIKFAGKSFTEVPLTPDKNLALSQFKIGQTDSVGSGTALYDAAAKGIVELVIKAPKTHEKIMVLFTDGMDGKSKMEFDQLLKIALKNDVKVYTITYGLSMLDVGNITTLAEKTGGRYYPVYNENAFPYVFADIYLTLNNYYQITYDPPDCDGIHKVTPHLKLKSIPAITDIGYYEKKLFSVKDTVGTTIAVNIEFEFGKADIKQESMTVINKVYNALVDNPDLNLEIAGHTDDIGSEEDNMELSVRRAVAVKKALVEKGINKNRLITKGFGEAQPLVPNTSEDNRRMNRRTELKVIKN